jgi:hypothetical protein
VTRPQKVGKTGQTRSEITMKLIRNLFASHRPETTKRARRGRHLGLESLEGRMVLSTFTVANFNDSGVGSLRQAILSADKDTGASTIKFSPTLASTGIFPQSALPILDNPQGITIDGSTKTTNVLVDLYTSYVPDMQDGAFVNRTGNGLVVAPHTSATIKNITLTGASARAVEVDSSTATLSKVVVSYSSDGGILNNGGTLSIVDSSVHNNTANSGGGVSNLGGTLTITGSDFESNSVGSGGAIFTDGGTVTIQSDAAGNPSLVGFNRAGGGGGGLEMIDHAVVTITNARFFDNDAFFGGAIDNGGSVLTATNSLFVLNSAYVGGALYDQGSTATVLTSDEFEFNTASVGGAIAVEGPLPVHLINTMVINNMASAYSDIYGNVVYGS